jgi:hypothetical protein
MLLLYPSIFIQEFQEFLIIEFDITLLFQTISIKSLLPFSNVILSKTIFDQLSIFNNGSSIIESIISDVPKLPFGQKYKIHVSLFKYHSQGLVISSNKFSA